MAVDSNREFTVGTTHKALERFGESARGGLLARRAIRVPPELGSGKTTFAVQFLDDGARGCADLELLEPDDGI